MRIQAAICGNATLPEETEQFIPNRRLPGFVLRETERSKDGNQKDKSAHRCTEFMTTVSHKWFLIKEHSLLCNQAYLY